MDGICDRCGEDGFPLLACLDCGRDMCGGCMTEPEYAEGICRDCVAGNEEA